MAEPTTRERAIELRKAGLSRSQIAAALGLRSGGKALSDWLRGTEPPAWTKRPTAKDDLRDRAIELRRKGWSYREIREEIPVSKSSLSLWLRDVALTEQHRVRLAELEERGRTAAARTNQARRIARQRATFDAARAQVSALAESELFVAGVVAYWAEGSKSKPWRRDERVTFMNSDARLIVLFLAWPRLVGVADERLVFRISIHERADIPTALEYWVAIVGMRREQFSRPLLKRHNPKTVRKNVGSDYHGCLIIYVRRSTELYREVEGWWAGIMQALGSLSLDAQSGVV